MDIKREALRELVIQAANLLLANAQPTNRDRPNTCDYVVSWKDLDQLGQAMIQLSEWEDKNLE